MREFSLACISYVLVHNLSIPFALVTVISLILYFCTLFEMLHRSENQLGWSDSTVTTIFNVGKLVFPCNVVFQEREGCFRQFSLYIYMISLT